MGVCYLVVVALRKGRRKRSEIIRKKEVRVLLGVGAGGIKVSERK